MSNAECVRARCPQVPETVGRINVLVIRSGNTKIDCTVDYKTVDGRATAGSDFKATSGTLEFKAGEVQKQIEVEIIDDDEVEDAEEVRGCRALPRYAPLCPAMPRFHAVR